MFFIFFIKKRYFRVHSPSVGNLEQVIGICCEPHSEMTNIIMFGPVNHRLIQSPVKTVDHSRSSPAVSWQKSQKPVFTSR